MHHKEIHISGKKSRSKEQTGSDRIRQEYISDIENYCIIKKFIYQIENLEKGTDRNRQEKKKLWQRKKKKAVSNTAQDRGQKISYMPCPLVHCKWMQGFTGKVHSTLVKMIGKHYTEGNYNKITGKIFNCYG